MTDHSFERWMRTASQLGTLIASVSPYRMDDPTLQALLDCTATSAQRAEFLRVCIPHMQQQLDTLEILLAYEREATP